MKRKFMSKKLVIPQVVGLLLAMLTLKESYAQEQPKESTTAPCFVLMGGGGTYFNNTEWDNKWFAINSAVSRGALDKLTAKKYHMIDYIVFVRDVEKRAAGMYQEMKKNGCQKVLQIAHDLHFSDKDPNQPVLTFEVSVMHLGSANPPKGKRDGQLTMASDYEKKYSYVLTTELMDNLSLSGVGEMIANNIDEAGVLK